MTKKSADLKHAGLRLNSNFVLGVIEGHYVVVFAKFPLCKGAMGKVDADMQFAHTLEEDTYHVKT